MSRLDRERKRKLRRKRRRIFIALFLVITILIIKTSANYSQKKIANTVQAGNVAEEIFVIPEKTITNMAFKERKKELENAEAIKIHEAKKAEIKKEREKIEKTQVDRKVAYLTFDDGPSDNVTPQILDILGEHDVKATFFIIGQLAESYPDILKRTYEEGHKIANHSYTHDYGYIYSHPDNLMKEINLTENVFKKILGEDFQNRVFRFPGGSFEAKKAPFRERVKSEGYEYYDWNSLNGDAEGHNLSKERLVARFKETSGGQRELVILMHDMAAKQTTADALPEIIEYLKTNGYEFDILE